MMIIDHTKYLLCCNNLEKITSIIVVRASEPIERKDGI